MSLYDVEILLSYFTPRRQLDFRADRFVEQLWAKIEMFRRLNRKKHKSAHQKAMIANAERDRLALYQKNSQGPTNKQIYDAEIKQKREQREEERAIKKLRKLNNIPEGNVVYKAEFAPEGTPLPEFSFSSYKVPKM